MNNLASGSASSNQSILGPRTLSLRQKRRRKPPPKKSRITRACDLCHRRSIKCTKPEEGSESNQCQNCVDFRKPCTYLRPEKKRGIKAGQSIKRRRGPKYEEYEAPGDGKPFEVPIRWKEIVDLSIAKVNDLVGVYLEVIYPSFPLFHAPALRQQVGARAYLTDNALFVDIMAVSALTSARARDCAIQSVEINQRYLMSTPSPENFFTAATDCIPRDLKVMKSLSWMRACVFLALYGLQIGEPHIIHQYLGLYQTLMSLQGLHDERNWPRDIGHIETETRRRVFWSAYNLDIFSATVFGSMPRFREARFRVSYPSEVCDHYFNDQGYWSDISPLAPFPSTSIQDANCWLRGWNFTTDLYRVLEHAMDHIHRQPAVNPDWPSIPFQDQTPNPRIILDNIMLKYDRLPASFKDFTKSPKRQLQEPFQAVNIIVTIHLVRMILLNSSDDATVDEKCESVRVLLDTLEKVPWYFVRAANISLLHQLAKYGSILGSNVDGLESPVSDYSYDMVLRALQRLLKFVGNVETAIGRVIGARNHLANQIAKIEQCRAEHNEHFPFDQNANYARNGALKDMQPELGFENRYPPVSESEPFSFTAALADPDFSSGGSNTREQFQTPQENMGGSLDEEFIRVFGSF